MIGLRATSQRLIDGTARSEHREVEVSMVTVMIGGRGRCS
jgi:hypothetical protein